MFSRQTLERDVRDLAHLKYKDRLYEGKAPCATQAKLAAIPKSSPFQPLPFAYDVKSDPFQKNQSRIIPPEQEQAGQRNDASITSVSTDDDSDTSDDDSNGNTRSNKSALNMLVQANQAQTMKDLVNAARLERKKKLAEHAKKTMEDSYGLVSANDVSHLSQP
jgi:hypothetical protein